MSSPRANIGRAEMEVLHYVAEHHPVSVRDVADHVAATKGHVRTTVLNIMERLRAKGYLRRKKVGGIFQYSPRVARSELLRNLVRDFVSKTLGGSVSPFVAYLTEEAMLTEAELLELRRLVGETESRKGDDEPEQ
jgi:predicted transcriptional regulator